MIDYVYLIPLVPLLASVFVLLVGREGPKSILPYFSIIAMGLCLVLSTMIVGGALARSVDPFPYIKRWDWFTVGQYPVSLGVFIDGPAAFMLFVVTLVSFLVQVYSLGYMHHDPRFKRFFAYVGFFTASMLGLVVSSNLLVVFACWELMGVSSYLLIGFWFEKPGPAYASKKAFITTKLGDLGFYLGLLLLFAYAGTFDIPLMTEQVRANPATIPVEVATAVGLLFLWGAIGKSAQVPLFVWLPDAMEGPTPVSALIHAATMVAAGIYLVARCYFLYALSPVASEVVAWTGLITAFMAATMAVVAYDLKRVLAFSTVSQLGYMMLGLGVGPAGYTAGLFHLVTHAFFKALLFLGAGSVIHAVHTNDMRQMGGLSKQMVTTFVTMAIATAAIAGFPGLSGFYSKEAILAAVYEHSPAMWAVALGTAGLTTFYMSRMMFLTFGGSGRDHEKWLHAHESPVQMAGPLWVLALLAAGAGYLLNRDGAFAALVKFESLASAGAAAHGAAAAEAAHGAAAAHHPAFLLWGAMGVMVAGFGGAFALYGRDDFRVAEKLKSRLQPVFTLLENRYGFDDFYLLLVKGSDILAQVLFWIDDRIIDRLFVDVWGVFTMLMADVQSFIDTVFVDNAVDMAATGTAWAGGGLRALVRGQVQEYLLYIALAVTLFTMLVFGQ
ncbi:MAG: NADH-quinone oxidoreductase subunit L [Elusimicrobia bacterium]|nr:NADH-quinone oxidoreductase subunit L [Elusimicrobiota bacterium]